MLLHRRARNRWAAGDCRQDICKIVIDSYLCNSENENGISPFNWHRVWRSIATSFANSRFFLHNKYVACLQLPPIWQRVIETAGRRTQSAVAVDRSGGGGETTNGSEQTNKKTVVYRVLQINSVYLSFFFSSKPTFSGNGSNGRNIGYTNWRFICVQISEMRRKANKTLVPDTKRHHNNWQPLRCLVSIGLSFCLSVCHRGCRRLWRRRRPHRPRLRCYLCTSLCVFAIIRFVAGRIQVNAQCITHCLAIYRLQTQ